VKHRIVDISAILTFVASGGLAAFADPIGKLLPTHGTAIVQSVSLITAAAAGLIRVIGNPTPPTTPIPLSAKSSAQGSLPPETKVLLPPPSLGVPMKFTDILLAIFAAYAQSATGGAKAFAQRALAIATAYEAVTAAPPVPPTTPPAA